MAVLASALDTAGEAFRRNAEAMAEKLARIQALEEAVRDNSARRKDVFEKRGQLLPR